MTEFSATPSRTARRTLTLLSVSFGAAFVLWSAFCALDFRDGVTWNERSRQSRYEAYNDNGVMVRRRLPRFYAVSRAENPKGYKMIVVLRGMMPTALFGVASVVCGLGAMAQPGRK